jgi:glucose/arabinose dehydrogenase
LYLPHDLVFHTIDEQTYLYVGRGDAIVRFRWNPGDRAAHDAEVVVRDLPSGSSGELRGAYAHELKNFAIDSDHRLYVAIASATNANPEERNATPMRAAIHRYEADGSNGRLFAAGLRNAEGVRFLPGSDQLWAVVNNRDNLAYPFEDGSGLFRQVFQEYVNNHPPEAFTAVRDGGDYGWPFAHPNADTDAGWENMPFAADAENNPLGALYPVEKFDRISKGIPAHSAPLGLTFLQHTNFVPAFANGAVVALHGSWNRVPATGYKVVYFPWNTETQQPGPQQDLVSGWLDEVSGDVWGRPVATAVDSSGNLLISDDHSGTIYRVTYSEPVAPTASGSNP